MHPAFILHPSTIGILSPSRSHRRRLQPRSRPFPRATTTSPSTASSPEREVDPRGFVLPQQGDVVLYPGRWPSEDAAGLVDSVRFLSSRSVHVVDIAPLKRVSSSLFAVPSSARRPKPVCVDVADVRLIPNPRYIASQDAYSLPDTRDGYSPVRTPTAEERVQINEEYRHLQSFMLRTTALAAIAGSVVPVVFGRGDVAQAFALGSAASLLYLWMLQRAVDAVSETPSLLSRIFSLRFLVPTLPFLALTLLHPQRASMSSLWAVPRDQALAAVLGILTYKVPILLTTANEFVDALADVEIGTTGMVGTVASMAARRVKAGRDKPEETSESSSSIPTAKPVLVFAGPSGVGKSTLLARLLEEHEGDFEYTVSYTTRAPREGEVDGEHYSFVTQTEFDEMVSRGEFVEHASVHGCSYGTGFAAVERVLSSGQVCVLDVDVQGVQMIRERVGLDWDARFVWVAPPSLEALETRLRSRGTETEETLKTRLNTAMKELTYAATNNVFDVTIVNDDVDKASEELRGFVETCEKEWMAQGR